MNTDKSVYIGVIGGSACTDAEKSLALEIGRLIAGEGWILVCGGMGGVMEAACKGAFRNKGVTIGILPGCSHGEGNPYLRYEIVTGLNELRNSIVVRSASAIIAIGGSFGTLSELAFAGLARIPVIGLKTIRLDPAENGGLKLFYREADTPAQAILYVREALGR